MARRIATAFLSTLSLRRATAPGLYLHQRCGISIHALLAESDTLLRAMYFAGSRFLSTLSLRRATFSAATVRQQPRDFYPRSPCGERQQKTDNAEGLPYFYPRSPCGERRRRGANRWRAQNFYPRSPCGERRKNSGTISIAFQFLSTLSLRRATASRATDETRFSISIHALLAESDWATAFHFRSRRQFLSTLSLRRATQAATWSTTWTRISIHALLAESDDPADSDFAKLGLFLSTLSLRRATNPDAGRGLL